MSTIQDVAKLAGVSSATVSRVLNNSSSVTQKTRESVMYIIEKLDYQPNLLGRNLRKMETRMVLILLPNISNPFYSRLVKGIEDIAHKNGYNVMLCNTDSNPVREKIYMELLKNRLADGVIFMAPEMSENELSEIAKKFPVVQCCEYKEGASVSHVSIDNYDAAYNATKHLTSLGHKNIAMISCQNNFMSTINREKGYKNALKDAGLKCKSEFIVYGDYGFSSGLRAGEQLLSMTDRPTAIFAISDIMAIGAIKAAKQKGLKVPDDIAVVGFDDISLSYMFDPMITTVSQPKYILGCTAMELLLKQIRGEKLEHEDVLLDYKLIIRESSQITNNR